MEENYEEVVRKWYNKVKPLFQNVLRNRFVNMSSDTIEDLYQDAFMAVYENIKAGRVSDKTSWSAYIIQIGLNLANKKLRYIANTESLDNLFSYDEDKQTMQYNRIEKLLNEHLGIEQSIYTDKDILHVLGTEIQYVPEPCSTIIRLYYYDNLSMNDISVAINFKNAETTKSKKSQCMRTLADRVKDSLRKYGIVR